MRIQETVRNDGLRIISGRVPSKKVHVSLTSRVGSAYDPPDRQGLYHYFEHMAFKGTEKRTVKDIRQFAARYLLHHNAATRKLSTVYYGTAVQRKLPQLCEFLCDTYFHSIYPEEEIEREKEVVLNEIGTKKDSDGNRAYFALWESLWQKNPLRDNGGGTSEGVERLARTDLINAHAQWHVPPSTVVIAVGDVYHNDLVNRLNTLIPFQKQDVSWRSWDSEYGNPPTEQNITIRLPEKQKATIVCGSKFPGHNGNQRIQVLQSFLVSMLVRGSNSMLWQEIREKRGFAYSVSGGISGEHQLGNYFFANASVLPSRIEHVCDLIYECILTPFSDPYMFEITKEWLYDWHTLEYDDLDDWAGLIANSLIVGLPIKRCEQHFSRMRSLIQSVTLDEVEALRASTLKREHFVTVVVRPE